MKIIIAPDSFKGSLSAAEVCEAIAAGLRRVTDDLEITSLPMADGGEGTVDALVAGTGGEYRTASVCGPLGDTVDARYGILGSRIDDENSESDSEKTAVIEMAAAAGLPLVPKEKRNPLNTTTFGLGQLILDAYKNNDCRRFLIGIGGSATNDGGAGMAQALGVKFLDRSDREISKPLTGRLLSDIEKVDLSSLEKIKNECRFVVACDVENPLLGPGGASHTYGPQKGATIDIITQLEDNLTHTYDIIESQTGRSVRDIPGSGAAGGLGAGLLAFLDADLHSGIDLVMEYNRFAQKIASADLIITGEGKIDETTLAGKTISGIASQAEKYHIPVVALAGMVGPGGRKTLDLPLAALLPIAPGPISLEKSMQRTPELLADTSEQLLRLIMIPKN